MTTITLPIRSWIMVLKVVCMIGLLLLILQCQDPHDWQPGDPQEPPPEPPALYQPAADTIFFGTEGCSVTLEWEMITGYQVRYEIQTDTIVNFSTAATVSALSSPASIYLKRYKYKTDYYCRVRAGSPAWTWYTDWSATRHFYIMPEGQ